MTTGGDALDAALGLLRAPSRRTALRWRPLPPGVTEVLSIAGGSGDSLAEASARTGYSGAELVEAARFFVQQVLFAEDADAYRVLGVASDAPHARIRDHHRLLIRWLHPDRSDEQWDSALSNRVNQAWALLRTDVVRANYDAALAEAAGGRAAEQRTDWRRRPASAGELAEAGSPRVTPTAPLVVIAVAVLCALLAWLVIRREAELDALRDAMMAAQVPAATVAAAPDPRAEPAPTSRQAPAPVSPPELQPSPEFAVSADRIDVSAEPVAASMLAAMSLPDEYMTAPAPVSAPTVTAAPKATIAIDVDADDMLEVLPVVPVPRAGQSAAARIADASQPANAQPAPDERAPHGGAPQEQAMHMANAAPSRAAAAPPDISDPLQLLREANATMDRLATYLVSADGARPPRYSNIPVRAEAAGIRAQLRSRVGDDGQQLELDSPSWRLGATHASLQGPYRVAGRSGVSESGWLQVELVRGEFQWQVASLRLVPQQ